MKKFLLTFLLMVFWSISCAQQIPVIIYHQIDNSIEPGQTVISRERFIEHLDIIKANGYHTVTVSELVQHMQGRIKLPQKTVVITLDDGFANNLFAAEQLHIRNMSATFYLLSSTLNTEIYFSKQQIQNLSKNPLFEIGAHTHTHFMEWYPNLDRIPDSVIIGEALMSKLILESIINKPITSFAWPFGYVRPSLNMYFHNMGFKSLVEVNSDSKNDENVSTFSIKRINIDGRCTKEQILKILETKTYIKCF